MVCRYRWDALTEELSSCSEVMSGAHGSFSVILTMIAVQISLICGLLLHIYFSYVKLKRYQYISPISRGQSQKVQLLRNPSDEGSWHNVDDEEFPFTTKA